MPRVSAQHEQEVRERIVRAATRVFAERGFHRATMQDIVRASGLSVGAIYTYFKSKDELILAGCDLITDQEMTELARRVAPVDGFRERIAIAVGFVFDQIERRELAAGQHPPARARLGGGRHLAGDPRDAPPPPARGPRRRGRAHPGGHRPRRVPGLARDRPDRGRARCALDGVVLQSIEEGAGYRRSEAERRVLGLIERPRWPRPRRQPRCRLEAAPPRTLADLEERAAS